jgi:hypothetical protein
VIAPVPGRFQYPGQPTVIVGPQENHAQRLQAGRPLGSRDAGGDKAETEPVRDLRVLTGNPSDKPAVGFAAPIPIISPTETS